MGGVAEHAHYQARAFAKSRNPAVEVVLLCSPDFLDGREVGYEKVPVFSARFSVFSRVAGRLGGLIYKSWKAIGDQWRLAWEVMTRRPDVVLLASYSEYLSPFWVWPHWVLAKWFGVVYVANLHDPVRDYVVGPRWWHGLSVRMAYWPIAVGVVHQRLPEPSPVPGHVMVVEAPVGVYDLQEVALDPVAIRAAWGVGGRVAPEDRPSEVVQALHGPRRSEIGDRGEEKAETLKSEKLKEDLTTEFTESTEGEAGLRLGSRAGTAFSNPTTSELARDSENTSLTRSASDPAEAALPPRTDGGSLMTDEAEGANPLGAGIWSLDSVPKAQALDSGRSSLDASAPADVVFLAFGFIRDNKNLDLVIRALVENPQAFLVVMGRAQSKKDKPVEFYRNLAEALGVGERVRFFDEFVPDGKLAGYFSAADVVVLTYDKTFHSQSGVLNVAARARRPVLASAGESPLKECVDKFNLGVFVEPDDLVALERGMNMVASGEWRVGSGGPDWEGYEKFASWDVNVGKILEAVEKVKN
jgi:glycosyltransferase involved in cell wall biosynthesis